MVYQHYVIVRLGDLCGLKGHVTNLTNRSKIHLAGLLSALEQWKGNSQI